MMLRKHESIKKKISGGGGGGGDSSNSKLFREVEALSRALAVEPKNPNPNPNPKPKPKPKPTSSSSSSSSSIWNWNNPLKSFSHLRRRRCFECRFSLRVRSIENLPPPLSSAALLVHWCRASDPSPGSHTRPVKASRGSAAFDETLTHRCSLYGTRKDGPRSRTRYEACHFLVHASVAGAAGLDLGKHRVELTRALPATAEEMSGEKSSGEWPASFRLSGKARGATLHVVFGYSVEPGLAGRDEIPDLPDAKAGGGFRRVGSVSGTSCSGQGMGRGGVLSRSVVEEVIKQEMKQEIGVLPIDLKPEYEAFSEPSGSPELKYCTLAERDGGGVRDGECDGQEFTVIEQGVEIVGGREVGHGHEHDISSLKIEGSKLNYEKVEHDFKAGGMKSKSLDLDAVTETVASEFLSMLGLENSPSDSEVSSTGDLESPRERLWRQFEKESLMVDDPIFGLETCNVDFSEDFDVSSMVHAAEMEHLKESLGVESKLRAQMLEDAETEALMQEWGLHNKAFEELPPGRSSGFGSPIHLPPEEPTELPPLGENLGPVVQTKDGGFLRSMSPSLFKNSKINGSLVMQASNPVVVPAEMGSGVMEILQGLASVGIEKLSMQAGKLMPLEDVTGMTMQQLAWEAQPALETCEREDFLEHQDLNTKSGLGSKTSNRSKKAEFFNLDSTKIRESGSEYVSLEDLAPLAMDKIEALSIEGLRIQSGMSDEEAPSNISPRNIGEISTLEGKGVNNWRSLGLEGAAGLQLLDVKDDGRNVDGLMGLTITLDEWMRLDSGVVDEDQISERTSKVLAAHHAKSTEFLKADKKRGKTSGRRWGLLGNNFTVALMVQLRDPLRDYQPVGTPMLALIQVERVFVPPKPRIYSTVSENGNSEQDDEPDTKPVPATNWEIKVEEDTIPQFKITEVHVAGLKTESDKKKLGGNQVQQQSGSRWLLANGMGKSNKHPFTKSNLTKSSHMTTKVQPGDTLWSLSSRGHGPGAKWKESSGRNPHIRNPNVIFSK